MIFSIIKWLKCHLFGRHNLRVELTMLDDNETDVHIECKDCEFCQGCVCKLYSIKEYTVYGKKKFNLKVIEGGNHNG